MLTGYCSLLITLLFAAPPQQAEKPLPDLPGFIAEFRKTLQSDSKLLSQYTYMEKDSEISLDSKGQPKKTETKVYQVIHGEKEWQTYERLISKNGVAQTEKELAKQDREEKERVEKQARKEDKQSEEKRRAEKAKRDKEEQETLDEVFAMYDIQMVRREVINDHPTILLTFKARPGHKAKTSDAKIMIHIAGRAWVSETEHELVRLEAEIIDTISLAAGLLARVNKGSTLAFERRKVNDEIWLPIRAEATINARILLLKGLNMKEVAEFSDHQKYSVESKITFGDPVDAPTPPPTPPAKPKP